VKAGVGVTCASPSSTPCYYIFTEALPGTENPITGCSAVAPGDDFSVDISNSPYGSSTFIVEMKDNGSPVGGSPITVTAPSKRDASAECIVQLPPGNVGITPTHYTKLADFGTVSFTNCTATATQNAGPSLDVDPLASGSDGAFTVSQFNMMIPSKGVTATNPPSFPNLDWSVTWAS
jgi:hypothetical protein